MTVLVVDDDVVSRMVLMHLIDSCGEYDIVEAENGADAWARLEDGLHPLICFCDLRMPRLSGMDLLQRVKQHPTLSAMPFVLVSSAADRATVSEAADAGAAGYVVKPFEAYQVRAHLDALRERGGGDAHVAEAPRATLARLGIGAERLLAYLGGLQNQLAGAGADIEALRAGGRQAEAAARLERLRAGCVALGLDGAAAALEDLAAGDEPGAPLRRVLASVSRAAVRQAALVRGLDR